MQEFNPSNALAQLATLFHELELNVGATSIHSWADEIDAELAQGDPEESPPAEWLLTPEELSKIDSVAVVSAWPPPRPTTKHAAKVLILALQALDRWHRPIVDLGENRLDAHKVVAAQAALEGYFGRDDHGRMIPVSFRPGWEAPSWTPGAKLAVLKNLLSYTAYLPFELTEDRLGGARGGGRRLRIEHVVARDQFFVAAETETRRIAIAPLSETIGDAQIRLTPDQRRYGVRPNHPADRLEAIVQKALAERADVLLIPELCVPDSQLDILAKAVREQNALALANDDPLLQYVFAGVAGEPIDLTDRHKNFVVILNAAGEEITRQDKLFPWDLRGDQIQKFGILRDHPSAVAPLMEDIKLPEEFRIIDLPGLGRLANLICADMSQGFPSDWFLSNLQVDWLHAPLMDQSLCWTFDTRGPLGPWIVQRSHCAAQSGQTRVLVTNSISLTLRVNETNALAGDDRQFSDCAVGLFVKGDRGVPVYRHLKVALEDIASITPVLVVCDWADGWSDFEF